jgi:hypothetical protein
VTSTAEALSGPWAANLSGWAASTALASLIVVAQEIATPLPHAEWIVLSILFQLVVSTLWGVAVAGISRHRHGRVVPVASGLLWTGIGVSRGVAGGVVAAAAGLDPQWAYRIAFWTLVSLCWMPLLTYALAQWDEYRRMLAVRADVAEALDTAAERAAESTDDRSRRMSRAVDDSLGPALDEIRAALRANPTLDEPEVGAIAARLDGLADRTAGFTAPSPVLAPSRTGGRVSVNAASNEFELRRPVFAALLAAAGTAPLILPEAFRDGGLADLAEFVIAIVMSTAALIGLYALVRPFVFAGAVRSVITRVGVLGAGLVGTVVMLLLPWDDFGPDDHVLLAVFPFVFWFAAAATGTAVALTATNVELAEHVGAEQTALAELATRVRIAEEETAARLETLVRGEVNGRVASCALALGLLADGGMPTESRERVIAGVLEQLDAAAAELRTP